MGVGDGRGAARSPKDNIRFLNALALLGFMVFMWRFKYSKPGRAFPLLLTIRDRLH